MLAKSKTGCFFSRMAFKNLRPKASEPTVQLHRIGIASPTIAYRNYGCRANGVSRAFYEIWADRTGNLRETSIIG